MTDSFRKRVEALEKRDPNLVSVGGNTKELLQKRLERMAKSLLSNPRGDSRGMSRAERWVWEKVQEAQATGAEPDLDLREFLLYYRAWKQGLIE